MSRVLLTYPVNQITWQFFPLEAIVILLCQGIAPAKADTRSPGKGEKDGSDEEEEEEASFTGDSSLEDGPDDEDEGVDPEIAHAMIMEEAKAMLQDKKNRNQQQYFEDEASLLPLRSHPAFKA